MAFSSEVTRRAVATANERMARGTFDCSSVAGGDIDTGLTKCDHLSLTLKGSAVFANAPSVNEDLPVDGSAVTIVTDSSAIGYWQAWGR